MSNHSAKNTHPPQARLNELADIAAAVLKRCRGQGASSAEVNVSESHGLSVGVRMGEVETVEDTRDRGLSLTVYFGQRKGNASTADLAPSSIEQTVSQACAIARHTEDDPAAGLADIERMAREFPDLDLWHPWAIDAEQAIALGIACETAGRDADERISNSEGASVNTNRSLGVYANSHGFIGRECGTSHSISLSLIAGSGENMQRDDWYSAAVAAEDLEPVDRIGRRAAEKTVARLSPRHVKTGDYPVLFAPQAARSLIGHLLAAVSGGSLYRQASFLLDAAGQRIFPAWLNIRERPHLHRGFRSAAFDAEGVATSDNDLIRDGVLAHYVLGSYSARKLGLSSTANAGGIHNLIVEPGLFDQAALLRQMGRGLYITELMGQGVNIVSGDYSRGAAGFRIENGVIAYPVDEITLAGNLRDMFAAIEAVGSDVDPRSHILTGSMLLGKLTVAGSG